MRTLIVLRRVSLLILLALFLGSCKHDLVSETTLNYNEKKNAADYDDFILPPETVTASSGESRCIKLSWTAVENAVRYQIFSAETPFDTFSKVIETKDAETSVILDEFAGITKYYTVCAVNYYGSVSTQSCIARGSTIAVPVITAIDASEDGSALTVSWWMDNCNQESYQNDIIFNVYVYKAGAPTVVLQKLQAQADERTLTINGLSSMTEYEFIVEAERKDNSAKETGSRTSAETAHRIIPDAPLNFSVEQGQSTTDISLSWELPSGAWYKENSGESGFVLHPLYFKVFRKLADSDADYEELFVLGAQRESPDDWKFEAKAELFFNCKNLTAVTKQGNDAASFITVTAREVSNTEYLEPAAPYDSYIPGAKITVKDTSALRGKKYLYYVQSYTDDTPNGKVLSTDSSAADPECGWQISTGLFSIKSDYTRNQENTNLFEKITFEYNFNFEDNDLSYKYIIEESKFALDDTEELSPAKTLKLYNSMEELNSQNSTFTQLAQDTGYYRYKLYLCAEDFVEGQEESAIQNAYACFAASGKYLVTDDASKVPVIENFVVKDGFKDHFELKWTYNPEYSYIIHFTNKNSDDAEEEILEIAQDDQCFTGLSGGDTVTYNHDAMSGDKRIYTLEASIGLSDSVRPNGDTQDVIYQTLGTPLPSIVDYDYDKITVSWPKVQKADDVYSINVRYTNAQASQNLVTDENTQITQDGETVKCVLTAPQGYNDAVLSGLPLEFTVIAKSSTTEDTSSGKIEVCTVGPALTQATIGTAQYDRINLSWNKVTGAQGYIIQRLRYTDGRATLLADSYNTYYFDGETLFVDKEPVSSERAYVVKSDKLFTLTDKYCEQKDSTSAYQKNQSTISWGLPFGYIVIPVKQAGSDSDFIFDGKSVSLDGENPVSYQNIALIEKLGATFGYGQKVHAQKSQSGSLQQVTWDAPYYNEKSPSVYYREFEEQGEWHRIKDVDFAADMQSASFIPENPAAACEYLIAYNKSTSVINNDNIPSSFALDKETGLQTPETDFDYKNLNLPAEAANKGYLLCVNYDARTGPDYSEIINWDEWDYSKRSIGPESAVVYIKNYNLSNNWSAIATLDANMHYNDAAPNLDNTQIEKSTNLEIKVSPKVLMDGSRNNAVTAGPLQVLRDARHYYAVELVRGEERAMIGQNESIYAYRNISPKELTKCALLNIAYGFYLDGNGLENLSNVNNKLKYEEKTLSFNGSGSASFGGRSLISALLWDAEVGKYKADVSMSDFAPLMLTPSETKSCVVSVSMNSVSTRTKGLSDAYLDKFRTEGFTVDVKKIDKKMPDSYSAKLTLTCAGSSNLIVKIGSETIVNTSDGSERKIYFPIQLDDEHFWGKDNSYGWWIKEDE